MRVQMFIENPAGSTTKHLYDEETLLLLGEQPVEVPYPFHYGFIPGVAAPDGDCLDCFLLDTTPASSGEKTEVELIGLLEQFEESGDQQIIEDHNVLARRIGDTRCATETEINTLRRFITSVFGDAGPRMHVGAAREARHAIQLLRECQVGGG